MCSERALTRMGLALAAVCASLLYCSLPLPAAPPAEPPAETAGESDKPDARLTVAAARERAKMMHTIYAATLDAMHHHYFHSNKSVLPARAMEDIFSDVARQSKTTARWISVNTKAMSLDHEPSSEFEKHAAEEIKGGKSSAEGVDGGYYRRAGAIPLEGGCVNCHTGSFAPVNGPARFAALVISVPVVEE